MAVDWRGLTYVGPDGQSAMLMVDVESALKPPLSIDFYDAEADKRVTLVLTPSKGE